MAAFNESPPALAKDAKVEAMATAGALDKLEEQVKLLQVEVSNLKGQVTNYEEQLERLNVDLSRVEDHIKPRQSGPYCGGGGSAAASREKDHHSTMNKIAGLLLQQIRDGLNGRPLTVTEAGKITKNAGLVLKNVANEMGIPHKGCGGKSQILTLLCQVFPYLVWEKKGIPNKSGGTHYEVELNFSYH